MPELPEVETVCRGLAARLLGRRLAGVELRRPDLRRPIPPDFVARVAGRRVERIGRRAKYILLTLDDGTVVLAHLGMSGRMLLTPGRPNALDPHDHLVMTTDDGWTVRFNDARRFGLLDLATETTIAGHPLLAGLGPEPLDQAFTGPALAERLAGKQTPIKAALLDQTVVAGVGNIYACEALFRARISPRRLAAHVQGGRADRLAAAIRAVLLEAIEAGGSSLRDHLQPSGELGYFQHRFLVYDREAEPCPTLGCGHVVRRLVQGGRSTFYCAHCQR